MTQIEEAAHKLKRLQDEYRRGLAGIDGLLRAAVSRDPLNIPEAEAVRASYGDHGFVGPLLAERTQPWAPEPVAESEPEPAEPVDEPQPAIVDSTVAGESPAAETVTEPSAPEAPTATVEGEQA